MQLSILLLLPPGANSSNWVVKKGLHKKGLLVDMPKIFK